MSQSRTLTTRRKKQKAKRRGESLAKRAKKARKQNVKSAGPVAVAN